MKILFQRITCICLIVWSVFVTQSCINNIGEDEKATSITTSDIPIKISAKTLHTQIYQKDCDEAIGLYVLISPAALNEERYVENKRFNCTTSGFAPDEEIYYPIEKNKYDFISYYPYQKTGIASEGHSIHVTVNADQSSTANYNSSDFMTAQVNNISSNKKSVDLPYTHHLCQLSIIIKPTDGCDMDALRKSNPVVSINNVFTQAAYSFETKEISSLSESLDLSPNGSWIINNGTLIGKKAILIPQMIAANTEIITLNVDSKSYSCQLTENYDLRSGTACELTLLYDAQLGVNSIIPSINEWKEGNKGEVTAEEIEEKESISANDFDFKQSNVFSIISHRTVVAEVCKEYLSNKEIQAEAIVIYPVKDGKSDWKNGRILQILDENNYFYGGKVAWNGNTLEYTSGTMTGFSDFYITPDLSITFTRPTEPLSLSIRKKIIADSRGNEAIAYPIVKIGTQYWMREDLRTTIYNDGKKITLKTPATYSKSTAGYFKEKTSFFYNKAAVVTGKLTPNGWKIADEEAWQLLKSYTGGDASLLKGTELWHKSEFIPSNKAGFNALPVGIFAKVTDVNSSTYSFANKFVAYWNMGGSQKTLAASGILLRYDSNEIKGAAYSDYCGYSIRCVQE